MHIAIEGMDAVGKTTVAQMLAEKLGMHYYSKSLHAMNDPSGIYDSFITLRELSLTENVDSNFGFRGSFLLDRVLQGSITSDRYLVSNFWAHTHGQHFDELRSLMEMTGEPDLTIILYAAPEVIQDRMVRRNPNDKDLVKLPFLTEAYAVMRGFAERCGLNCIWFDTSEMTIEEVIRALADLVNGGPLPSNGYFLPMPGLRQCETNEARYTVLDGEILKQWTAADSAEIVRIPDGIRELRPFSLLGCDKIKEIYLSADVCKAPSLAFAGMDALERIEVSPQNKWFQSIDGVLYDCDTNRLIKYPSAKNCREFSAAIGLVDNMAFCGAKKLETLKFAPSLRRVGFGAFYGCSGLREISFDGPVEFIGQCAFLRTSPGLAFHFQEGGRYESCGGCVVDRAKSSIYFVPADVRTITLPTEARQLGPWAAACLQQTGAVSLDAPVRRIGPYAFANSDCGTITLPASVEEMDDSVFLHCQKLHTIVMQSLTPPVLNSLSLDGCSPEKIKVPNTEAYAAAKRWGTQK